MYNTSGDYEYLNRIKNCGLLVIYYTENEENWHYISKFPIGQYSAEYSVRSGLVVQLFGFGQIVKKGVSVHHYHGVRLGLTTWWNLAFYINLK